MSPSHLLLACVLPFGACAAFIDLRTGHIPNRLVFWGWLSGTLLHVGLTAALPASPALSLSARLAVGLFGALAGALSTAAVPYLLFRAGAMGGGDVKLLGALGAALGPRLGLEVELFAFALAGLYAPALLLYRGELWLRVRHSLERWHEQLSSRLRRRAAPRDREAAPVPQLTLAFGPAVFAASLLLSCIHSWPR
jgi:prepilin peptidase CpaA